MTEWTIDTLKDHLDSLRELDRFALDKADNALTRRLDAMNEVRDQLREQAATFVDREYYDTQHNALGERVGRVETWQAKLIGGLILATFIAPTLTGLIVYILTRNAIPVK